MISNPHVFEGEYVPDRLLHRDAEQNALARAFEPALRGERPDDVLLYGPHGVGKTALVRHTVSDLQDETDANWAHIRTMGETVAEIVREALRQLGGDPGDREPLEDVCLALRERVTDPTVVVLDEADDLNEDVLRRLTDVSWVGVVPIVHDPEHFRQDLDDHRVQHRLTGAGLQLSTYAPAELADILEPRVRKGLRGGVDRSYLERIADRSSGTARNSCW
ncbi:AAA family ATPase [Halosimplex rubrum]|uniref:AAA family ATPase n=1 Tax=Halosimplex rubrum TaxID=869889 RepID=A0A7D5PBT9_9EURY|nr:AAA family ATPase [Halosimplex rubrum]QLH78659.1 AAA family ATPase [Halosimplex rubrum]